MFDKLVAMAIRLGRDPTFKEVEQDPALPHPNDYAQGYYIIAVWVIGWAADIELRYAALATILLFAPFAIPIVLRLKYQEESEKAIMSTGVISK